MIGEYWEHFISILSALILISSAVGAVGVLTSKGILFKKWNERRAKRARALSKLAEIADSVVDLRYIQNISESMSAITLHVDKLETTVKDLEKRDIKQNKLIEDIYAENSIFCEAMLGLLDHAIKNGANGTAHKARNMLEKHINEKAHRIK